MIDFLSNIIKKERIIRKLGNYYVKIYLDRKSAYFEYYILKFLFENRPDSLIIPEPVLFIDSHNKCIIVTKEIKGKQFYYIVHNFIKGKYCAMKYIALLGKTLRDMHQRFLNKNASINIRTCNIAASPLDAYVELISLLRNLINIARYIPLINIVYFNKGNTINKLLDIIKKIRYIKYKNLLFNKTLIHGELYFTHIYLQNAKRIAFLDFGFACKGPIYVDLAVFPLSIYLSLTFIKYPFKLKDLIRKVFLKSYFRGKLTKELDRELRLLELYVLLRILNDISRWYYINKSNKNLVGTILLLIKLFFGLNTVKRYVEMLSCNFTNYKFVN